MTKTPEAGRTGTRTGLLLLVLLCVGAAVYSNSLGGLFLFDDFMNIVDNPSIRQLWPPWQALAGSWGNGISGRPLANFSFAVNYAIGGLDSRSYHLFNLIFHLLAGALLFGIALRALASPKLRERYSGSRNLIAFFIALLWLCHPLQTQAVTYVTERIESMMSCFLLACLYFAIRGWEGKRKSLWHLSAVAAFFAGAGVKEVIIVAPLLVLLYDVIFEEQQPAEALKSSPVLYLGLAAGVVFLIALVLRGGTAYMAYSGAQNLYEGPPRTWYQYFMNQPHAITTYMKLAVWPRSLLINYEWSEVPLPFTFVAGAVLISLLAYTLWLIWKKRPGGFVGAWFFLILAPSSSIMPLWCDIEEHRMYLPLAAPVALFTLAAFRASAALSAKHSMIAFTAFMAVVCALMGGLTYQRNFDYADGVAIWKDAVAKRPQSASAQLHLGVAYMRLGRYPEALAYFRSLDRDNVANPAVFNSPGVALTIMGNKEEAEAEFREAIAHFPRFTPAYGNLGILLMERGRNEEAVQYLTEAVRLSPRESKYRYYLAKALAASGRLEDAVREYEQVLGTPGADPAWRRDLEEVRAKMQGGAPGTEGEPGVQGK
ncbi:MAG: tetratricopeptide repeat protein [Thermodesulfobacteriota bacterium]